MCKQEQSEQFGKEWKDELMKMKKEDIIFLFKNIAIENINNKSKIEELSIVDFDLAKEIGVKFFYWWYNQSGNNTEQGFKEWYYKEYNKKLKTSAEWQKILDDIIVLDPDGWDRNNFNFSWYEELIFFEEYQKRLIASTCKHKFDIKNDKNKN